MRESLNQCSPDVMVNKLIGSAYPTVKLVAQYIPNVSQHMEPVYAVHFTAPDTRTSNMLVEQVLPTDYVGTVLRGSDVVIQVAGEHPTVVTDPDGVLVSVRDSTMKVLFDMGSMDDYQGTEVYVTLRFSPVATVSSDTVISTSTPVTPVPPHMYGVISGWKRPDNGIYPEMVVSGTKLLVPEGSGYIVNGEYETTKVNWDAQEVLLSTLSGSVLASTVVINASGVAQFIAGVNDPSIQRSGIVLGSITKILSDYSVRNTPAIWQGNTYAAADYAYLDSIENLGGDLAASTTVGLGIDITAETLFRVGGNANNISNPNIVNQDYQSDIEFYTIVGSGTVVSKLSTVPVGMYNPDGGDSVVAVGVTNPHATIMRLYQVEDMYVLLYGQTIYASLNEAMVNVDSEAIVVPSKLDGATLVGFIVSTVQATDLSDPDQAILYTALNGAASISAGTSNAFKIQHFTATAGQTYFPVVNVPGKTIVIMDGATLEYGIDYSSDGNGITLLGQPADLGDALQVHVFKVFEVADVISPSELIADSGASLVGFIQSGIGAVARTVQSELRDTIKPEQFEAIGGGVVDDTAAMQNAINAADGKVLTLSNNYKVTNLTVPNNITINGNGYSIIQADSATGVCIDIPWGGNPGLQTIERTTINNLRVTRSSIVTGTVGISCANPVMVFNNVETSGFDRGVFLDGAQFGTAYSLKAFNCNVGLYIKPTLSGGGGNSLSFYDHQGIGCNVSAVLVNNTSIYPNNAIYFYNPSWLGNSGATLSAFNATVSVYGGAPEGNNGGAVGGTTYDGVLIKYASVYANKSTINFVDHTCNEGSGANPVTTYIRAENYSRISFAGVAGYGVTLTGTFCYTDDTSFTIISGDCGYATAVGTSVFNGTLSGASNNGSVLTAQDSTYLTSSITNEASSPLTSSLSNAVVATTTTGWDTEQGRVGIITFDASAGNQESNRVLFASIKNGGYSVVGFSVKSDVDITLQFGVYGSAFQGSQKELILEAGEWVRHYHIIANTDIVANSYYVIFSKGGAVANVSVTKVMIKSSATNTPKFWQDANAVLNGAYNPNIGALNYGKANSAAPSTGTWVVGDTVYNTSPSAGGYMGWVCTTAGTPGTWKGFGLIQA